MPGVAVPLPPLLPWALGAVIQGPFRKGGGYWSAGGRRKKEERRREGERRKEEEGRAVLSRVHPNEHVTLGSEPEGPGKDGMGDVGQAR